MKSVRLGCVYRYDPDNPISHSMLGDSSLVPGEMVKVVNLPGGSRGGCFRNVESLKTGGIGFVRVILLKNRHRVATGMAAQ